MREVTAVEEAVLRSETGKKLKEAEYVNLATLLHTRFYQRLILSYSGHRIYHFQTQDCRTFTNNDMQF